MSQITQINLNTLLDKFCRICSKSFNENQNLTPIFNSDQQISPIEIIEKFHNTNFQVLKDDGLPQNICKHCIEEFKHADLLITKCEKSQNILNEQFQKLNELHEFFDIKPLEDDDEAYTIIEYKSEDCDTNDDGNDDHFVEDEEIINDDDNSNNDNFDIIYEAEFLDYNDDININNNNYADSNIKQEILTFNEERNTVKREVDEVETENLMKPYACLICSRNFRTISIRDKHMTLNICSKNEQPTNNDIKLENPNDYTKIEQPHFNEDGDDYEIPNDIKKSKSKFINNSNDYHKYHCLQCYHSFGNFKDFMEHKKSHITEKNLPPIKRIYLCDICGKDFSKKQSLEDHENVHKGIRPYACHLCEKSFTFKQILKSHLAKHGENAKYNCAVCNKTFTSKQYFNEHKKRHETGVLLPNCDKLFKCPHCPKSFKLLSTLTSHCSFHNKPTESKYHCTDCGAIFKRSDHLKEHINAVHLNIKPFSCDLCSKKFVTGAHRNAHKRKFHSGKRFQCDVCDKDFSLNTSLTRHKRIHTGEKRYKCEICNESFMAIYQIEKHLESHKIDENEKNVLINQTYADIQQSPTIEII